MKKHTDILLNNKLRVTEPRLVMVKVLHSQSKPVSAEYLIQKTQLDKVTVYRTLHTFVEHGLLREIDLRQGKLLYELADRPEHHHVVCTDCGVIEDVDACVFESLQSKVLRDSGFAKVTDHAMEFFGLCKQCDA